MAFRKVELQIIPVESAAPCPALYSLTIPGKLDLAPAESAAALYKHRGPGNEERECGHSLRPWFRTFFKNPSHCMSQKKKICQYLRANITSLSVP